MLVTSESLLVYCVILNLDGRDVLVETLETVERMAYPNFRMVVVDNGSRDGSQDMVRSRFAAVTLIENGKNLGFGGGNNVALQYALEQGADWVFLLNNDITVAPDLLTELMAVTPSDGKIGILGPKIYYHSEPEKIWYTGGNINYFTGIISHRGLREEDRGQYDRVEATDYITGCAMLIKRGVLEEIGMFDPVYHPIYSEDADLCVRAKRAGYRIVYVPKARLWHKVSSFSGGGLTPFKTKLKVEHNLIFFKRYARWYHWLTIPWFVGALSLVFIGKELLKGNLRIVLALLGGVVKAMRRIV